MLIFEHWATLLLLNVAQLYSIRLIVTRSQVPLLVWVLLHNFGRVIYTLAPLATSSIIWYRWKDLKVDRRLRRRCGLPFITLFVSSVSCEDHKMKTNAARGCHRALRRHWWLGLSYLAVDDNETQRFLIFRHSDTVALSPERHSVRMSKN